MIPAEYIPKTKMMVHQKAVFERSADLPYWGFFCDPGTGKSKMLVDNAAYLYQAGKIKALVVCSIKGMLPTWEMVEIPKHMPDSVSYQVFRYDNGKIENREYKERWSRFIRFAGLKVFIYNTESAGSIKLAVHMRELYGMVRSSYLFGTDESSMIKTHTAIRTKATIKFSRAAKYRRILTGTPVTNSGTDIFGQAMALEAPLKILKHSSFVSFRNYFSIVERKTFGNRSFDTVTGQRNTEELTALISSFASIIKKEDALDLPGKIYSTVVVEMTTQQKTMYDKLRQEAIIALEGLGEDIEVTNILTMLVKLHQIVCGQLKIVSPGGSETYATIENNRVSTLMDILSVETGKVVIWATYKQSIADISASIREKYGDESVIEFHGSTPTEDREVAAKHFQDLGHPSRFFIGNPQSAGMGLTLTTSDLAVYFSNNYSLEQRIQSEARIDRIGQTKIARYVDLYTPGTVDEKILKALQKKQKFVDRVILSNWRDMM